MCDFHADGGFPGDLHAETHSVPWENIIRQNRVYMLAVSDNKKEITMIHEWVKNGKSSIRQIMSGMQIQKVPLLVRCQREGKTMIMKSPSWEQGEGGYKNYYWRFIAVPLKEEGEVRGFLCVENARVHTNETALLNSLLPYLLNEYKRFRSRVDTAEDTHERYPEPDPEPAELYRRDLFHDIGYIQFHGSGRHGYPQLFRHKRKVQLRIRQGNAGIYRETLTGLFWKRPDLPYLGRGIRGPCPQYHP